MIYKIYSDGKDTKNGPFSSREAAEKHIQKLKSFIDNKIKSGRTKYKQAIADFYVVEEN